MIAAPKPECTSDSECSNDKACINEACKNPCLESNVCAANAKCHVQMHRPLCVCHDGMTGNAHIQCYESKWFCKLSLLLLYSSKAMMISIKWYININPIKQWHLCTSYFNPFIKDILRNYISTKQSFKYLFCIVKPEMDIIINCISKNNGLH